MANMTFAKNPVMSTLRQGWNAFMGGGKQAYKGYQNARKSGSGMWDSLGSGASKGAGAFERRALKGTQSMIGTGAVGAAGLAAGGAAADLANPWGLGWGD